MSGILNDQDLARITDICQTYNLISAEAAASPNLGGESYDALATTSLSSGAWDSSVAHTPEVVGTPQKGMGLRTLRQTVDSVL